MVQILRNSIRNLCSSDHKNDPNLLGPWLSNKTVETFAVWHANQSLILRVATLDDRAAGFAMASSSGEVMLNYVAPNARFQRVSTVLLGSLEQELFRSGLNRLTLSSTQTAHAFYRSRGWVDQGDRISDDGIVGFLMHKTRSDEG